MSVHKPIHAVEAPIRRKPSVYPEPFASRMGGRTKRPLGSLFQLNNFGVNLTTLEPGASSSLQHAHAIQDEFIYVIAGNPTLLNGDTEQRLEPGMVMGFPAKSEAHCLRNDTDVDVTFLEIGDRTPGDQVTYPNDDLMAVSENGAWVFKHKDGSPY